MVDLNYGYLVVEGPHDVEFVGRLLKLQGLARVTRLSRLDTFWTPIVPRSWPVQDDLARRVPVPVFFANSSHSVAVHSAIGESRIAAAIEETLSVMGSPSRFSGIGAILDADSLKSPRQRFQRIRTDLNRLLPTLPLQAGDVSQTQPRTGAFIIPDNTAPGTLEDILLECAEHLVPGLLSAAEGFVAGVDADAPELAGFDLSEFRQPAGRKKTTFACLAGIFKPCKAIQNSIQDDEWISSKTALLERVDRLRTFIESLLLSP